MKKTKGVILAILAAVVAALVIIGPEISSVTAQTQQTEPELEDFVPSEELPTDSAVAFPVDI